jgi:hypothetical protein
LELGSLLRLTGLRSTLSGDPHLPPRKPSITEAPPFLGSLLGKRNLRIIIVQKTSTRRREFQDLPYEWERVQLSADDRPFFQPNIRRS